MNYEQAIDFLQEHLNSMYDTPENLVKWGDCIVAITDHVNLLTSAIDDYRYAAKLRKEAKNDCGVDVIDYVDPEEPKRPGPGYE